MAIDIQLRGSEGDLDHSDQDNPARQILETQELAPVLELPEIGEYMVFEREKAFDKLKDIKMYLIMKGIFDQKDYDDTATFLNNIFDIYEGKTSFEKLFNIDLSEANSAFVVPARGEFPEEAIQHLPITRNLKPLENADERYLFRELLGNLCPFVLTTYEEDYGDGIKRTVGLGIYSPQNLNLLQSSYDFSSNPIKTAISDQRPLINTLKSLPKSISKYGLSSKAKDKAGTEILYRDATASVNEALSFAKRISRGNVVTAGLGAVLPKPTNMGKNVDEERLGITATTGHRLTIYAVYKAFLNLLEIDGYSKDSEIYASVTGVGYIGNAISHMILATMPNAKLFVYDKRKSTAELRSSDLNKKFGEGKVRVVNSSEELFENANYNMAAPTGKTKLIKERKGQITIDDSEPSSEDAELKAELGGAVIKPVFSTERVLTFDGKFVEVTRRGPNYIKKNIESYDYGWFESANRFGPGLIGDKTFFGCEFEAWLAGLAYRSGIDVNQIALKDWVRPESVIEISNKFGHIIDSAVPKRFQGAGIDVTKRVEDTRMYRNPKLAVEA